MAQSLRILNKPFSNYYGLFFRPQNNRFLIRSTSNSCDFCGLSHSSKVVPSTLLQKRAYKTALPSSSLSATRTISSTPIANAAETKDGRIIYVGGIRSQIKYIKIFTLTTSTIGIALQPLIWIEFMQKFGPAVTYAMFLSTAVFTLLTPLLIHYLARKYILDIHYNPQTELYKASLYTFFLRKEEIVFKQEDVVKPDMLGLFETFRVRGRSLFVDPSLFADRLDYVKLMGYDKPMDFTYYEEKEPSKKE